MCLWHVSLGRKHVFFCSKSLYLMDLPNFLPACPRMVARGSIRRSGHAGVRPEGFRNGRRGVEFPAGSLEPVSFGAGSMSPACVFRGSLCLYGHVSFGRDHVSFGHVSFGHVSFGHVSFEHVSFEHVSFGPGPCVSRQWRTGGRSGRPASAKGLDPRHPRQGARSARSAGSGVDPRHRAREGARSARPVSAKRARSATPAARGSIRAWRTRRRGRREERAGRGDNPPRGDGPRRRPPA